MKYEALLDEAYENGLVVKEKPLQAHDGRIKGNRIAIRSSIETNAKKGCVLAEELYAVTEWNDQPGHNSESTPLIVSSNLAADLRTCSSIAFCIGNRLPEDAYLDLCGRYGASPDFSYAAWQG